MQKNSLFPDTCKRIFNSVCIVMILSYSPIAQEKTLEALRLGFPFKFYTVHIRNEIVTHFGIGAFLADVLCIYLGYLFIKMVIRIAKKYGGDRE